MMIQAEDQKVIVFQMLLKDSMVNNWNTGEIRKGILLKIKKYGKRTKKREKVYMRTCWANFNKKIKNKIRDKKQKWTLKRKP